MISKLSWLLIKHEFNNTALYVAWKATALTGAFNVDGWMNDFSYLFAFKQCNQFTWLINTTKQHVPLKIEASFLQVHLIIKDNKLQLSIVYRFQ